MFAIGRWYDGGKWGNFLVFVVWLFCIWRADDVVFYCFNGIFFEYICPAFDIYFDDLWTSFYFDKDLRLSVRFLDWGMFILLDVSLFYLKLFMAVLLAFYFDKTLEGWGGYPVLICAEFILLGLLFVTSTTFYFDKLLLI